MANTFPMYVAFQSKSNAWQIAGRYLRYVDENVPSIRSGYIQISGNEVVNPYTKFEIEAAETHNGLIHIKSSYNNKYLARVSRSGPPHNLAACVSNAKEDRSDWECTLFQPFFTEGGIELLHVQLNTFVTHSNQAGATNCLHLNNSGDRKFGVIDWDSLSILPDRVVFKGSNDRYAIGKVISRHNHIELSASDIAHQDVGHKAFTTPHGYVRIRSDRFNMFWKRQGGWIMATSSENNSSNNSRDTMFQTIKVGPGTVALRNMDTQEFVTSYTKDGKRDTLAAVVRTIDKRSILKIEEPIWSRTMYNVFYHQSHATIYNEEVIAMVSTEASNASTEDETIVMSLTYVEEFSRSWSHSTSVGVGVKSTIKTKAPFLVNGEIDFTSSAEYSHEWGKTQTGSKSEVTTHTTTVPAGTRVKVRALVMKCSAQIPYSYTQDDRPMRGTTFPVDKTDGIYNCMDSYFFDIQTTEEALDMV